MNLPPYQPRPNEDLLEKCARLKRELQQRLHANANDNEPPRPRYWWLDGDDPA